MAKTYYNSPTNPYHGNTWDTSILSIKTSAWQNIIQSDWTVDNSMSTWITSAKGHTGYYGTATNFPPSTPAVAPKEFNRYVNASDLLEEFIAYAGSEGVRQGEVLDLPVELFVKWLVIRACEEDQVESDVVLALPAGGRRRQPRCLRCQRFMTAGIEIPLHDKCVPLYMADRAARVAVPA